MAKKKLPAGDGGDVQKRVDSKVIRETMTYEMSMRDAQPNTYVEVTRIIHKNMLEETVAQTYARHGMKSGDRSALTQDEQIKLLAGEIGATSEMRYRDAQGHEEIVEAADEGSQKMADILNRGCPWRDQ